MQHQQFVIRFPNGMYFAGRADANHFMGTFQQAMPLTHEDAVARQTKNAKTSMMWRDATIVPHVPGPTFCWQCRKPLTFHVNTSILIYEEVVDKLGHVHRVHKTCKKDVEEAVRN